MPRLLRLGFQIAAFVVCAAHAAAQPVGRPLERSPDVEHSSAGGAAQFDVEGPPDSTIAPLWVAGTASGKGALHGPSADGRTPSSRSQLAPPSREASRISDLGEAAEVSQGRIVPGDHDASANAGGSIALPPREASETMSLAPRNGTGSAQTFDAIPSFATVFGSLAIVLGLFLIVAWTMRRKLASGPKNLPSDVVESLGRTELPGHHELQLVRCGRKLLLLSVSAGNTETLTEITDPIEVDRLAGLCHQKHGESSTHVFSQVFDRFGNDTDSRGFAPAADDSPSANSDSSFAAGRRLVESRDG